MQPTTPPPGPPKRNLSETVWTKLDRKATAIAEFTMRQYRKKRSTWTVGAVGALLVVIVLLFYIDAMSEGIESVDDDGDGLIDEDPSVWTLWEGGPTGPTQADRTLKSVGDVDDDGDCWAQENFRRDQNGDGIDCNVIYEYDRNGNLVNIRADRFVDEDPNDGEFLEEAMHRSFLLGFGKFGFLFILGIFVPLFLATGLIREEMDSGTLHYLVGKPIARAEILMYRLLGFIGLAWPYFIALFVLSALVTGIFGPGDSIYRFSDLGIWFGILIATFLTVLAYAAVFITFGIVAGRYGVLVALLFAVWEFFMMFLAMIGTTRDMGIASMSISFWGSEIINSTAWIIWGDYAMMSGQSLAVDIALWTVWYSPFPTTTPLLNLVISIVVLLLITGLFVLIGQSSFKKRELN
ncbi:MAG: ABC transporter permease subunit [Candidatus Thalassarchaeaceae archaeon]|jgi:ABC-type transport system involved in multi-copper enzyme maturation permease subunit|nr:ABC transporter permease subunit [Candidatus Thalassarchaeaceae archaeon]MDP6844523.1 ABC transporter permease subunit [Candidatus Thalassarchaeaceae archaeon]